jgi:hypothetical protein
VGNREDFVMAEVFVKMKDGTNRDFRYQGRCGGSYTNSVRYEGAFAIIKDEWGTETVIPADDIAEIKITHNR